MISISQEYAWKKCDNANVILVEVGNSLFVDSNISTIFGMIVVSMKLIIAMAMIMMNDG